MNTSDIYREGLKFAYELLEQTMAGVTPEMAAWTPPGKANPLGAVYAHALLEADEIRTMLSGSPALYASTWSGLTGVSQPQYRMEFDWARSVSVDLLAAHQYGQAVYRAIDSFIAGLSRADLQRKIDLTGAGFGWQTVGWCLNVLIIAHFNNMTGEISVLKGLQGEMGYPF